MANKAWQASINYGSFYGSVCAQALSSKHDLLRRLLRDDPIWAMLTIKFERKKRWKKKHFKRGLAIRLLTNKYPSTSI